MSGEFINVRLVLYFHNVPLFSVLPVTMGFFLRVAGGIAFDSGD